MHPSAGVSVREASAGHFSQDRLLFATSGAAHHRLTHSVSGFSCSNHKASAWEANALDETRLELHDRAQVGALTFLEEPLVVAFLLAGHVECLGPLVDDKVTNALLL